MLRIYILAYTCLERHRFSEIKVGEWLVDDDAYLVLKTGESTAVAMGRVRIGNIRVYAQGDHVNKAKVRLSDKYPWYRLVSILALIWIVISILWMARS